MEVAPPLVFSGCAPFVYGKDGVGIKRNDVRSKGWAWPGVIKDFVPFAY